MREKLRFLGSMGEICLFSVPENIGGGDIFFKNLSDIYVNLVINRISILPLAARKLKAKFAGYFQQSHKTLQHIILCANINSDVTLFSC